MAMTAGIYVPMYRRILKRKHTRDYSRTAQWFITLVQVNNLFLAVLEHAPYLVAWYILQTILCGTTTWFLYHYWNAEEPRLRKTT